MRTRYWTTVVLAGFAVYTAIAVLGSISTIAYFNGANVAFDLEQFVANRFLEQWTCALFVAPLFVLVDHFPVTVANWRRRAPLLLAFILMFVVIKYAIMMPLYRLWTGSWGDPFILRILDNAVPVTFDFVAILGIAHALRYYRAVGERERAAAALQTQLAQARLDALRGQLHPHFIFNTLNAAATLMHDDVDAADRMLTQLGDLLRMSLDRGQPEITLDEELQLAGRYLAIMRHRFADRLTVHCDTSRDVGTALVPTFFIQPLIENALEHGIARRPGPGCLRISARRSNGALEVIVADDGPGVVGAAAPGIGLTNTRARLEQLYGGDGAVTLETAADGGARAVVRIPFRECRAS